MNWNWIPQLFYDFLARVLPGAVLIPTAALVAAGPADAARWFIEDPNSEKLFSLESMLLFVVAAYLVGLQTSQIWRIVADLRKPEPPRDKRPIQKSLIEEHNRVLAALGRPQIEISATDLPRDFVMLDHLRDVAPSDVSRMLKVRAERRFCQVLVVGFIALAAVNGVICLVDSTIPRLVLEVILLIFIVTSWRRARKFSSHYAHGICISWLMHVTRGELYAPAQKKEQADLTAERASTASRSP